DGITGSGKNRRVIFKSIFLNFLFGTSLFVNDVKGENYYYTSELAKTFHYQVYALDLRNPKKSVHYNFLQPIINAYEDKDTAKAIDCTWDLVAALVGEPKGEPIWTNGETSSIAAAILSIVWEAPIEYKNMVNVYFFIANMCKPDDEGMPLSRFLEKLPTTHPARSVFAMAEMAHFRTRSSFFVSALGTLKLFTNPFIAEMTSKSDFDLKDLTKEKSILYLILPDEKKTMYSIATLLITQLYMQQVELANKNGGRIPIGFNYFIDEAGNCPMIPILETGTTAGRSRGIGFHLFVQSYFQLKKIYKDSYETIKTNCEVKIHLKADDEITLKEISTRLDTYTVETASASTSISDGKKNDASYSSSAAMTSRALLTPGEVGRFESPDALVMFTSKFPAITKLTDISNSYINELFGLGNETHNQELIMKRESKRKEREIIEMIPLWEIWKMYEIKEEELLFQKPQEQVEVLSPKKKNSFL
ncbi:MAG: type IV secretory system conjugative DNA transfer family protein, partial [Paludibacteraceae bacterium]